MNYLILNNKEYFQDKISLKMFKEVSLNGRERIDGLFGEITRELLESTSRDDGARDKFFEEGGVCRNRGFEFIIFKIPEDLFYYDETELIEECFGFIDENVFSSQIWSFKPKNQKWQYFLIGIKKSHGHNYIFDTCIDSNDESYGIKKICKKIEEVLYGDEY